MGDTTSATDDLWQQLTARIMHPAGSDLLQRHLLCQATGLHDNDGGRCRDCGRVLDGSDDQANTGGGL